MKNDIESTGIATRSRFVAPVGGGALAGVCPQGGFRAVAAHAPKTNGLADRVTSAMFADLTVGHRSWSPPIT